MPFFLLLLLALAYLQPHWPSPPEGWDGKFSVLATFLGLEILFLWALLRVHQLCRRLQRHPHERYEITQQFIAGRRKYFAFALGFFLASLYALGWGSAVQNWWKEVLGNPPGFEVVLLSPFFASLFFGWFLSFRMEKLLHDLTRSGSTTFPSGAGYILLHARQNLLLIVPPMILMLIQQALFFLRPTWETDPALVPWFTAGLMVFALVGIPILIRAFLGLRPLPRGPLRERLEATARRLNFRFRDIYVWHTRNTVANAMVTGFFARFRYIILTDRLMAEMSDEEIEAVFGHEVGHIKHHHLVFYMIFMLGSMVALTALWNLFDHLLQQSAPQAWLEWLNLDGEFYVVATLPLLLLGALYFFLVFGYLSRRCERQADLFGSRTTSYETFMDALEKVALINGIPRKNPGWVSSWQHASIAERVEFLDRARRDPGLEISFQWRIGLLQGCVALFFLGVLWMWGPSHLASPVNGLTVRVIQK